MAFFKFLSSVRSNHMILEGQHLNTEPEKKKTFKLSLVNHDGTRKSNYRIILFHLFEIS